MRATPQSEGPQRHASHIRGTHWAERLRGDVPDARCQQASDGMPPVKAAEAMVRGVRKKLGFIVTIP